MKTNGSTAFNGVARASFSTMVDPDDPKEHFLFLPAKTNFAPRGLRGFGLKVKEFKYKNGVETVRTTKAVWGKPMERTADAILSGDPTGEDDMSVKEKAKVWLAQKLRTPTGFKEILEEGKAVAGEDTLRRVLREIGKKSFLGGQKWVWTLKSDN